MKNSKCIACDSSLEIKKSTRQYSKRGSESEARNSVKISSRTAPNGRVVNTFEQTQFIVRCSNPDCLLHSLSKKFWSAEDAIEKWNNMKGEINNEN